MNQKTIKLLCKINLFIDEEQQKLYNKLKNIELSHNRKYKLLEDIEKKLKFATKYNFINEAMTYEFENLIQKINNELTFIGRAKGNF